MYVFECLDYYFKIRMFLYVKFIYALILTLFATQLTKSCLLRIQAHLSSTQYRDVFSLHQDQWKLTS